MRRESGRPARRRLDTFDDLLAKPVVLISAGRLRREGEDRLAVRGALFEADALADRGLEEPIAEHLADRLLDVARQGRSPVVERDDRSQKLQVGIGARADLLDGLEQVVRSLE